MRVNGPFGADGATSLVRVADAKPVVVVMEDVAASAGYMIAMAGEQIFVSEIVNG